ncbi:MAG: 6-pyruvoyl trahydropterin synthase family protein [Phycisphaerales bacterium]|jgi:6-pyruvoyltetrahydropterin/6-carboxytetrahydropterin synthase
MAGIYRVCKVFEVESGHMLMKHPGRCRFPHGHSRRVEVVVSCTELDPNDMVCDFKALKLAVGEFIDRFDHAMAVNSDDDAAKRLATDGGRIVVFDHEDPTTEVMARRIFEYVQMQASSGAEFRDADGNVYRLPKGLKVERVRVGETSTSWAEYGIA